MNTATFLGTRGARRRGAAALGAAAALAVGAVACSSDDSENDADGASAQAAKQVSEKQIRSTFDALQDAFTKRDAPEVCDQLTGRAQEQTARDGGPSLKSCEDVVKQMFVQYGDGNLKRNAKVVRVRVDGDRALATVTAGQTIELPAPFLKTDDGWKMDESLIPQN
jgi:hypothetical protein